MVHMPNLHVHAHVHVHVHVHVVEVNFPAGVVCLFSSSFSSSFETIPQARLMIFFRMSLKSLT